jgi:hypothetical protein
MSTNTSDVKEILNMVNSSYGNNIIFEENWERFEFKLRDNYRDDLILCISNCEGCYQYLQGVLEAKNIIRNLKK